ncbi:MAG: hypothetical protein PHQ59_01950 [Candidatus Daviesbacteria bacterium]|nr:hypothetical protein [Candidatus Daviesbacteria bacterium]
MGKGLLNYTTEIEAYKTINEIQQTLAVNGAKSILSNYNKAGQIEALSFSIDVNGKELGIKLPCDKQPVLRVLEEQVRQGKIRSGYANEDQALRVAWRIVKVWIDAQMAILQTKMVKMEQIFLPYMVTKNGQTLFETLNESGFKMLGSGDQPVEGEVIQP